MQIQSTDNLSDYYARRANEYERIYAKPERQNDLALLSTLLPDRLAERKVLEVACGTGYWTEKIAKTATSIYAVDVNDEVLHIARSKHYPHNNTAFARADAYSLNAIEDRFDAGLALFWWSHIPKSRIGEFLCSLHGKLSQDAVVVLLDNAYVAGSSTPISHQDAEGNSYQIRILNDGSRYKVLKNFPTENELISLLTPYAINLEYQRLPYYWLVSYQLRADYDA